MTSGQVEGSIVFVTGANRGLGRALVATALSRGAARVYAATRDLAALDACDPRVTPIALDLTDHDTIARAADRCADTAILINNAAYLSNTSAYRAPDVGAARLEMETNYFGLVAMVRRFAPVFAAREQGAIVNILSMGALASVPFASSYCASKAAAWSFTQSVHAELRDSGLRVMAVFPGPIATEMARETERDGRALPQDIADAIYDGLDGSADAIFPDPVSRGIADMIGPGAWQLPTPFAGKAE